MEYAAYMACVNIYKYCHHHPHGTNVSNAFLMWIHLPPDQLEQNHNRDLTTEQYVFFSLSL